MTDVDKTRPDVECAIFAELALMQTANNVTIAALRYVHGRLERGMNAADIGALMNGVTTAFGGTP